jgi:hypothetical protein
MIAGEHHFQLTDLGPVQRFQTRENELGSRVILQGTVDGVPVTHYIAAVFAEDFCSRLSARITDMESLPSFVELADNLIRNEQLGLGIRRRRFLFSRPPNWHAIEHGLDVALYPPEYPLSYTCIWVSAADIRSCSRNPKEELAAEDARQGLHDESASRIEFVAVSLPSGLSGKIFQEVRRANAGPALLRDLAIIQDDSYDYCVRVEAVWHDSLPAHRNVFLRLLESIEPLPVPSLKPPTSSVIVGIPSVSMWGQ